MNKGGGLVSRGGREEGLFWATFFVWFLLFPGYIQCKKTYYVILIVNR